MLRDTLKYDAEQTPPAHLALSLAFMHVLLVFDAVIFIPNVLGKTVGVEPRALAFITFATILNAALFTFLQSRTRLGIGSGFRWWWGWWPGASPSSPAWRPPA